MKNAGDLSLRGRALQLLAQREHSRLELRRKLLAHAASQAAPPTTASTDASDDVSTSPGFSRRLPPTANVQAGVDTLLDWLAEYGHLSEARFVEARVRTRAARFGNLRIVQELAQHGLQLAPDVAQALKENEFVRARQAWARKFDAIANDAPGLARQVRFLARRGFSSDVVRRVVKGGNGSDE